MGDPLRVGAAFPDPPFNGAGPGGGLDVALMSAVAELMGRDVAFIAYPGADFNGIFDTLNDGGYDCVTAGTTVTPERARKAAFCDPYLISGQSLAADITRLPHVRSIDDLAGLTIGVQRGNTSEPIAQALVARGRAKAVRVYPYGDIATAITDLTTGGCDAVMKLAPVLTALVGAVDGVQVVQRGLSTEAIATAVRIADHQLREQINAAQAELERTGKLAAIRSGWLGDGRLDQAGKPASR